MDVSNRYASTIMLAADDEIVWANCSGILLSPRVALTAASCVCPPRYVTSQGRPEKGLIGPSACAESAFMRRVRYGTREGWKSTEQPASATIRHLKGTVRVHPAFRTELNEQGAVLSTRADLAIIVLDSPEEEPVERIPFPETEVRENEMLVMAGYGDDPRFRDQPELRYYRSNKVTKVPGSVDGRIRYEQQGAFVYNGYAGGPCFREDAGQRWLVGIAGVGTEKELSFTSTYFFRDWLRAELQRVATAGSSQTPPAAVHPQ
ncbi:trypsin-like peptidase domain-containing protein [Hyalangium gracile]|uniref:trypsin-like peptidase domain-containing protein n=1 Tax=Hyalangium gracile TaxID=394092 RepID=UPI001CCB2FBB|nr:trypsin-like peptidase domain-containing protein [Hyalangium gracile]